MRLPSISSDRQISRGATLSMMTWLRQIGMTGCTTGHDCVYLAGHGNTCRFRRWRLIRGFRPPRLVALARSGLQVGHKSRCNIRTAIKIERRISAAASLFRFPRPSCAGGFRSAWEASWGSRRGLAAYSHQGQLEPAEWLGEQNNFRLSVIASKGLLRCQNNYDSGRAQA